MFTHGCTCKGTSRDPACLACQLDELAVTITALAGEAHSARSGYDISHAELRCPCLQHAAVREEHGGMSPEDRARRIDAAKSWMTRGVQNVFELTGHVQQLIHHIAGEVGVRFEDSAGVTRVDLPQIPIPEDLTEEEKRELSVRVVKAQHEAVAATLARFMAERSPLPGDWSAWIGQPPEDSSP